MAGLIARLFKPHLEPDPQPKSESVRGRIAMKRKQDRRDKLDDAIDEARGVDHTPIRYFSPCTRWMADEPGPLSGKVRHAICLDHGGRSRNASVDFRWDRCSVARRMLPKAR